MYRTFGAMGLALFLGAATVLTNSPVRADFDLGLQAYQAGDLATARTIWQPLAEQNDPAAQRNLALIMLDPRGGKPDPVAAANWLKKAADSDFPRAHYDLAYLYFRGNGVSADNKLAAEHMQKAATLGLREAQHDLAVLFEQGIGVDKNADMAVIWYRRAVQSGYAAAVPKLTRLLEARKSRTVRDGGDFVPLDKSARADTGAESDAVSNAGESASGVVERTATSQPAQVVQGNVATKKSSKSKNPEMFQHLVKLFQADWD